MGALVGEALYTEATDGSVDCTSVTGDEAGEAESNGVGSKVSFDAEGAMEGSRVVAKVGFSVGVVVGEDVTSSVAATVGLLVGPLVGFFSGLLLGKVVGLADGWKDGPGVAFLSSLPSSSSSSCSFSFSSSFTRRPRIADVPRTVVAVDAKLNARIHRINKRAVFACIVNE
jgi:hypothetical protein